VRSMSPVPSAIEHVASHVALSGGCTIVSWSVLLACVGLRAPTLSVTCRLMLQLSGLGSEEYSGRHVRGCLKIGIF